MAFIGPQRDCCGQVIAIVNNEISQGIFVLFAMCEAVQYVSSCPHLPLSPMRGSCALGHIVQQPQES